MGRPLSTTLLSGLSALLPCLLLAAPACSSDDAAQAEPPSEEDAGAPVEVDAALPVDAAPLPVPDAGPGCPVLTFPSGVAFQTKVDPALTDAYRDIAEEPNYPLPLCFIDTENLVDVKTGKTVDVDVEVGKYFTLRELVGTSLPYTKRVLLSPLLVEKMDRYRDALAQSVNVTSGFRSPIHQRAVCRDMCGKDFCPGTCAQRSRHSWGDAVDHGVYPAKKHSTAGCKADFNYVFREGDHVHLDLNPEHPICTVDVL